MNKIKMQCAAHIEDSTLPANTSQVRQCRNTATYYMVHRNDRGLCTTHRRSYDHRPI